MLRKGIPLKEGVEEFLEFSGDLPVLGHNVMFDYKFMKMAAASFKYPFEKTGVDTLKVARKLLTGLENKKLETLCAHYHYGIRQHTVLTMMHWQQLLCLSR